MVFISGKTIKYHQKAFKAINGGPSGLVVAGEVMINFMVSKALMQ
jgi:hypothetical protein